ncbi:MAG: DUF1553 domain-containing protein [Pirellulaceae bacterium]
MNPPTQPPTDEPPRDDRVFDSLLEEFLTQQHPPDLTARIVTAWRRQSHRASNAGSSTELIVAAKPIQAGKKSLEIPDNRAQLPRNPVLPHRIAWMLAVCAALILVFVGIKAVTFLDHDPALANQDEANSATNPSPSQLANNGVQPTPNSVTPETIELDDLPFNSPESSLADTDSPSPSIRTVERLPNTQVVAEIDQSLANLWHSLQLEPNPVESADERARRVIATLTGLELPAPAAATNNIQDEIAQATHSMAFARRWAANFTQQWFDHSNADAAAVERLTQEIAVAIEQDQPWNSVMIQLLGGDLTNQESTSSVFVSALAGGENHRLIDRLGAQFLDANLTCVRCHDANGRPERATDQQATYWSLVALLKGIDSRQDADQGKRVVQDLQAELFSVDSNKSPKPEPSAFYDLPSGVLKSAAAQLPDGSPWQTAGGSPRVALANWVSQSPEMDRATVNHVWKLAFGRFLVPQVVAVESAGMQHRTELLGFLATQFRAHNHNLKDLVGWVVSSEAFAREPLTLTQDEWLNFSDQELELLQLRELVFAAGPSLQPQSQSLEASLATVIKWNTPTDIDRTATLAQPSTDNQPSKPRVPNSVAMPSLSYILHGQQPTISQESFVNRLLRAKRLSWEQRVDHVVGLSNRTTAGSRVQQLAKELLEQNNGDARAALLHLLWAVQNGS